MNLNNFFSFFFRSVLIKSGCYFIQLLDGNQIPVFEKKILEFLYCFLKRIFPAAWKEKKSFCKQFYCEVEIHCVGSLEAPKL